MPLTLRMAHPKALKQKSFYRAVSRLPSVQWGVARCVHNPVPFTPKRDEHGPRHGIKDGT